MNEHFPVKRRSDALRASEWWNYKYKYNVKSGLSYKDTVGLRLQVNRVDSGLNDLVADLDYYWLQEHGNMCQPAYMVLDRSQ